MISVLGNHSSDRPGSQMSFLDQFLKESNNAAAVAAAPPPVAAAAGHHRASNQQLYRPDRTSQDSLAAAARRGLSIESVDADVEDNRVGGSVGSSRSNVSDLSPQQDFYAQPIGGAGQNVPPRMFGESLYTLY